MLITDLDGTLLNDEGQVSTRDLETLKFLGQQNILRVIATGRSYFSLKKVLSPDFPVDFVILSSGAGIMDWKQKELIAHYEMEKALARKTAAFLMRENIDFMVHDKLPENHYFLFSHSNHLNCDFKARLSLYAPFAKPLKDAGQIGGASQFVLIFRRPEEFTETLRSALKDVHIIRATSPLDKESVWFELMPKGVSKQAAAQQLVQKFNMQAKDVLALGNDYNDQDMLDWAGKSFVTANAAEELKKRYLQTVDNNQSALSKCVTQSAGLRIRNI